MSPCRLSLSCDQWCDWPHNQHAATWLSLPEEGSGKHSPLRNLRVAVLLAACVDVYVTQGVCGAGTERQLREDEGLHLTSRFTRRCAIA